MSPVGATVKISTETSNLSFHATISRSSSLHHLVPKLTGTNYSTWATQLAMVLIKDDLWLSVCEESLRPERPAQEVRQWDSDGRKATANKMLCLREGAEQLVKGT